MKLGQVPEVDSPHNQKIVNPLDPFCRYHILNAALSGTRQLSFLLHTLDIAHGRLSLFLFHVFLLLSLNWAHLLRDIFRVDKQVIVLQLVTDLCLFGQKDFVVRIGTVLLGKIVSLN
jgi:hypothetical protein